MTLETFSAIRGIYHAYRAPAPGAPTLVFANSLGTDLRVWDRVVVQLPSEWGLLRHDKRGHGLSISSDTLDIETMATDVETLLYHYGIADFIGIGLSVGGLIMQALALRHPQTMRRLVLADTAAKIGAPEIWNPRIDAVRANGIASISDAILARWFAPGYETTEDFAMWHAMLERTPDEGYAQVCAAIRDADYTDDLARIVQPTLLIAGAQDTSTPPDLVRATADKIPSSRFVEIDAAGHLPCVEQPARFVELLHAHIFT